MYAQIVLPRVLNKTLTYLIPEPLKKDIWIGQRVLVPLGRRELLGFVVGISTEETLPNAKPILSLLEKESVFSEQTLSLCEWVCEYYFCFLGECLQACLPPQLYAQTQLWVRLASSSEMQRLGRLTLKEKKVLEFLRRKGEFKVSSLGRKLPGDKITDILKSLERKKLLRLFYRIPRFKPGAGMDKLYALKKPDGIEEVRNYFEEKISHLKRKAPTQASFLEEFLKRGEVSPKELKTISRSPHRILESLKKRNLIEAVLKKKDQKICKDFYPPEDLDLNPSQKKALGEIEEATTQNAPRVFLLFGGTSLKRSEVYLEAIKGIINKGKTALVLVPEISLTPKTIQYFESFWGGEVGCLHSGLSSGERFREWQRIKMGEIGVVVGTRSSVFAPLLNLGLIVVDEEQDPSFKQEDQNPRYNARDVAVMRAKMENCVAILGSSTPSMESFLNVQRKKYTLLPLHSEEDRFSPRVSIVDMRGERKRGNLSPFSNRLNQLLEENIKKERRIVLFLNRRGFSKVVKCQDCGYVFKCPHCGISLTYHLAFRSFKCHYCGYVETPGSTCPDCRSFNLSYRGFGTEKIEEEIKKYHPQILYGRMDSDTVKSAHLKTTPIFDQEKCKLIFGTQMIQKELDLPDVGLVGIISADFGIDFPDFRSREKTFQILCRLIGKADKEGQVVIQTHYPSELAIRSAGEKNYLKFFTKEIEQRKELDYPPFTHLVLIKFSGENLSEVKKTSDKFSGMLKRRFESEKIDPKRILGPALAFRFRVKRKKTYQILLKARPLKKIMSLIGSVFGDKGFKRKKTVRISVNVDPMEIT